VSATVDINPVEQAGYFEVPGAHLYTVVHKVSAPLARVLLIGAFASERHTSYLPWVRWARYLAARGIECIRFDYRGMGESTGSFEEMSFSSWAEDVELLVAWLDRRGPRQPLLLHGLELGALLASQAFTAGVGDALLMWAPPQSANEVLRPALLRRIAVDNMFRYGNERKGVADYLAQLDREPLEVEGYQWSSRLWRDSFHLELPAGAKVAGTIASDCKRPVRTVPLDKCPEPLVKGSISVLVDPDLSGLFADNFQWITTALVISAERQ
jgi:pimeloyl-ACP methyl ester carboxylesterase